MNNEEAPTRGTVFEWRDKTWTVTSVARLPHDESGTRYVRARNSHGDMIRFGPVSEWVAKFGQPTD